MKSVRCGNDDVVPRTISRTSSPAAPSARSGDVPPATRATTSGWRDPRLWIGVVLVCVAGILSTQKHKGPGMHLMLHHTGAR